MSRNEQKYPNPSQFSPERFLDAEGNLNDDTVDMAFGFGRRFVMISLFRVTSNIFVILQDLRRPTFCRRICMDSNSLPTC